VAPLSAEENELLLAATADPRVVEAKQDIIREGDHPTQCTLIVDGFACRYKLVESGTRQILSFHIAGDFCDLQSLSLARMDHGISTVTKCSVAFVPHATIKGWCKKYPSLTVALWRDTLLDAAVFREWIVNVGARPAYERTAHLLCEVLVRLDAVGLVRDQSYSLPLTQAELADAIGVSPVHMNRVIQKLRKEDLITLQGGTLKVQNWEGLKSVGGFDPAYLHVPNS